MPGDRPLCSFSLKTTVKLNTCTFEIDLIVLCFSSVAVCVGNRAESRCEKMMEMGTIIRTANDLELINRQVSFFFGHSVFDFIYW